MILLSFDIEEFDLPLEYGREISFEDQMVVSKEGTQRILQLLEKHRIQATFYITANFAQHAPEIVARIADAGHEVASHGYFHSDFRPEHLKTSKELLEAMTKTRVEGYRMARMMPVTESEIKRAGYSYNSSINPTFLPGRYNNLKEPRRYFLREGVWQLPVSVSPFFRFPLFWLSFRNLPESLYRFLVKWTCKTDGYLNVYFHPWEFMPIGEKGKYSIPGYVTKNTGKKMEERLGRFIDWAKKQDYEFVRTKDFINKQIVNSAISYPHN
ncbi:MAG: polysaccharide deacetylase family protein [Dysgonamonadaceae bacterium]|jgi:peptidoglycan/xylan/chitin deacetylase (PgdA/CDA1 family)|nr:polysaccharide deacetylase family protein [Dysgonamonadaceae bacterium]